MIKTLSKTILAFAGAALMFSASGCAAWAHHGDINTMQGYEDALRASPDPADRATLLQIESGPADLAREKAAAMAAGIPLTDTSIAPPAGEDAAPLYLEWAARKRGKIVLPIYADALSIRHTYMPEQLARVQAVFDSNPQIVALRDQAIAKPELYAPFDPKNLMSEVGVFAAAREAARENVTQSYLLANAKNYGDAITVQTRDMQIARQLDSHPAVIRVLVGDAVEAIALGGYRQIAVMAGPDAAVDSEIAQTVQSNLPRPTLKEALINELPREFYIMESLRRADPAGLSSFLGFGNMFDDSYSAGGEIAESKFSPSEQAFINQMVDAAEAVLLARTRTLAAAADEPPLARQTVFDNAPLPYSRSARLHRADYFPRIANITLSLFGKFAEHDAYMRSDEQVTLASVALLKAKAQTGSFPEALPGDYPDAFSGKPLGYRREGENGFVVYSVGKSGHFDGGRPGDKVYRDAAYFRYPPPAPTPVPKDEQ